MFELILVAIGLSIYLLVWWFRIERRYRDDSEEPKV